MKKNDIITTIKNHFNAYPEEFADALEALDDCRGVLTNERHWPMEDFDELHEDLTPSEVESRISEGHDEVPGTAFNFSSEYFYYTADGVLVSTDHRNYSDQVDDYIVNEMVIYRNDIQYALEYDIADLLEELANTDTVSI